MSTTSTTVRAKLVTATNPTIYNLAMAAADTEYAQALNTSTKKILIRMRTPARARIAFSIGATSSEWITLEPGSVYFEENLDLTDVTIFVRSAAANQVAEILEWT